MKVIVCGGRNFSDRELLQDAMDEFHQSALGPIERLMEGGAPGADRMAALWAMRGEIPVVTYRADWRAHGRAAGPIRNQRMLEEGVPDAVIAFPGGAGTADMVRRATAAGVPVFEIGKAT